jgi:hypothetical protein
MNTLAKNKKLTLGVIFLMLIILAVQLVNLLGENEESDNDKFEFIGAYYELRTNAPDSLKNFYFENFNFYPLNFQEGDYIANDAIRFKIEKAENWQPQKMEIRVNKLSRLFRKLISNKIEFLSSKHLNENDFLEFSVIDPAGDTLIFIEE